MFLTDLFFALLIALLVTGILTPFFRRNAAPESSFWPPFLFIFLIMLAFTWAGGVWVTPFGPTLWGGYWLPFLMVAFVVALLLAAMAPHHRRRGGPVAGADPARGVDAEAAVGLALGAISWIVITVLGILIVMHYL
jgi:hypothetical protein